MKFDIITSTTAILFVHVLLIGRGVNARGVTRMDRVQEVLRNYQRQKQKLSTTASSSKTQEHQRKYDVDTVGRHSNGKDYGIRRAETFIHDIASMGFLENVVRKDDNNDTCTSENQDLSWYFSSSTNPIWFYYIGYDNFLRKDFSPYFECTNALPDYINCDYTDMLEYSVGPCQFLGGTMYSVSLNQTCSGEDGIMYNETNVPMCLGASCTFNESSVEDDNSYYFDYCEDSHANFEADVVKIESLVSEECDAEVQNIKETTGLQDPDYIFIIEDIDVALYCTNETIDGTVFDACDFTPLLEDYREPCENEGGILYKFSDMISATEGYYDAYDDLAYELTFKNIPICVGASCHAKKYFEKYIFPYFAYGFEGDFYQEDNYYYNYNTSSNYIYRYTATYRPLEYAPVLKTENPYSKFLLSVGVEDGEQVDEIKMCKWLSKRTSIRKQSICSKKKYQVYSEQSGLGPASIACPDTCAPYCHAEKRNAKFIHKMDDTKGLITKQCKWLESQDEDVIASICDTEVDAGDETMYGQAAETCTETCGSC